jgi:hypothetical protein
MQDLPDGGDGADGDGGRSLTLVRCQFGLPVEALARLGSTDSDSARLREDLRRLEWLTEVYEAKARHGDVRAGALVAKIYARVRDLVAPMPAAPRVDIEVVAEQVAGGHSAALPEGNGDESGTGDVAVLSDSASIETNH